jgi:hypothetical protein
VLWLGVAYIVRYPRARFKNDLTVALWGGFPLLVVCAISFSQVGSRLSHIPYVVLFAAFICIFSVVYISLYMPAVIREFFNDSRFTPDPLSLRVLALIVALGVGAILHAHIKFGFLPSEEVLLGSLLLVLLTGWFFGYLPAAFKHRLKEARNRRAQAAAARWVSLRAERAKDNRVTSSSRGVNYASKNTAKASQSGKVAPDPSVFASGAISEANMSGATTPTLKSAIGKVTSVVHLTETLTNADKGVAKALQGATVAHDPAVPVPETANKPDKSATAVSTPEAAPSSALATQSPAIMPGLREPGKMQLKLKRSQRSSFGGKVIYILDARIAILEEDRQLVEKYRLGDLVIYDSTGRKKHDEALRERLESTKEGPSVRDSAEKQLLGLGRTLGRFALAGLSATMASLSLRVTVYSLIKGVHVECKSMGELLEAEAAIIDAGKNVRTYLTTAATFDGREEILEF